MFIVIIFISVVSVFSKVPSKVRDFEKNICKIEVYSLNAKFSKENKFHPIQIGSGFRYQNYVITNYHVIEEFLFDERKIFSSCIDTTLDLKILWASQKSDLAVLTIKNGILRNINLNLNVKPIPGENVYVIGSPMGLENSYSTGIISAVRMNLIQITAPISSGSSGSPVFDEHGTLIGVAFSQINEGQNLNFAIPAIELEVLFNNIEKSKKIKSTYSNVYKKEFEIEVNNLKNELDSITLTYESSLFNLNQKRIFELFIDKDNCIQNFLLVQNTIEILLNTKGQSRVDNAYLLSLNITFIHRNISQLLSHIEREFQSNKEIEKIYIQYLKHLKRSLRNHLNFLEKYYFIFS